MIRVFVNLKRFDVPRSAGGVCPADDPGAWIVSVMERSVEIGLGTDPEVGLAYLLPEALILPARRALDDVGPSGIAIGCQTVHHDDISPGGNFGAFTGGLPASAAANLGCSSAMVGHSEERRDALALIGRYDPGSAGQPDAAAAVDRLVGDEAARTLEAGLSVLLCVGETADRRDEIEEVLDGQLAAGLAGAGDAVADGRVVIGYEPVWAIGPGRTPPEAEEIGEIADLVGRLVEGRFGVRAPVVYGGGLKEENAAGIGALPAVAGGLVALTRFTGEIGFDPDELGAIVGAVQGGSGGVRTVDLEYGDGMMTVEIPDDADLFVPGETVPDPPALDDPVAATLESIRSPLGMPPIPELVGSGSTVVIVFPDKVKGGAHETAHRRVAVPMIIDECVVAGVDPADITLICSNGLHRKNTPEEIRSILGDVVFDRFWESGQIVNHDSEDRDNLVDLGEDEMGNLVIVNKTVVEADLAVQVGHALGNPYGGYSGGYKHCSTGITHWRTIGASHIPRVMHRPDFTPVRSDSLMRTMFDSIGAHIESSMRHPFFTVDAALDTKARQLAVFSGLASEVQRRSWEVADRRTNVAWATRKYDVMVFGMPREFHYGNGHGTNPILIQQAIAANVIRHKRVLADDPVVIALSVCDGFFNDVEFPAYRELYGLMADGHSVLADVAGYTPRFVENQEYVDKYRHEYGYHPFHGFSMISCGHIAERECAAVFVVGAEAPEYARAMGMETMATFQEALADAERHTGPNPAVLVLPKAFRTAAVHLAMAEG